jgi:membrane protease subunit (stomatin/prohibitin family)
MAIIDLVKWDGSSDVLAWKFPSKELSTWSQLIVNESQDAYLVSGGVYEGPFPPGRHVLNTENIPILRAFIGLPYGGQSPYSAEVWFVNKTINLNINWGTQDPIQLKDPAYDIMVPVRAFGQYGIKISNSKKFLLKLVGTLSKFDSKTISEYFKGVFLSKIKVEIANAIIRQKTSVLEISTDLTSISDSLKVTLSSDVDEFGVELVQFNIISINVPEDDSAVIRLKEALARKAEMGILGFNYQQERSLNILEAAAGNQGAAGGVMGAGIGLGMGGAVGIGIGQAMQSIVKQDVDNENQGGNFITTHNKTTTNISVAPAEKIKLIKELAELRSQGILTEQEFTSEKTKIMSM